MYFLPFALLLACGTPDNSEELPKDYESLHKLRHEKNVAIKELQAELQEIEKELAKLDTNEVNHKKVVTTMTLEKEAFKSYKRVQGSVEAEDVVSVTSEMGGRITSMHIEEGQSVNRGQLVATLDMESVEKQKAELETQLELAQTVYERQKRLWDQEIGSEIQYLEAKTNVERLERSIESINSQLKKSRLYAPISGVVDVLHQKSGESAVPGMPIATILSTTRLKVTADAPENLLGKMDKGDAVKVFFPSLGEEIDAKISSLGRKIDPANRTLEMEVNIPTKMKNLKPNVLAEVLINDYTRDSSIVLPVELVQQEVGGKNFVMIVAQSDEGKVAAKQYVTIGKSYEGDVVIAEGLTGNEEVIKEGARGLASGEHIEIKEHTQLAQDGEEK